MLKHMAVNIDWRKIRKGEKFTFDKIFDLYFHPLCANFPCPPLSDPEYIGIITGLPAFNQFLSR